MNSSLILLERSRLLRHTLPHSLTFLRHGGGPRTFPGGLNKWQWKRLHEKQAREKEKRLLDQEKQIYQARVRSEIRSNLSEPNLSCSNFKPVSPKQHVRILADRFMKEGAEDLWNENDGPVSSVKSVSKAEITRVESYHEPVDLKRVVSSSSRISSNRSFSKMTARHYSVRNNVEIIRVESYHEPIYLKRAVSSNQISSNLDFSKMTARQELTRVESYHKPIDLKRVVSSNQISSNLSFSKMTARQYSVGTDRISYSPETRPRLSSIGDVCLGFSKMTARHYSVRSSKFGFRKNDSSSSEDGTDDEEGFIRTEPRLRRGLSLIGDGEGSDDDGRGNEKKVKMSAALGKYDMKKTKRIPLKFLEAEDDLSLHVQAIRNEVSKRRMVGRDEEAETIEKDGLVGDGDGDDGSILSSKRFDECNVSPLTIKALTLAGYVQMTKVQEATISACLEGKDVLVKAKTGTGKSAAFLLPAIETVLKASDKNAAKRVPPICVLILCPTRELASQIAAETNLLLKFHDGIGVQTLVGGTRFKVDQKRLETEPCQIIIATPGRLLDHIENKTGFSARLMGLNMLILDEADHLLDLGFRKDLEKIVDCLPRQKQSLLFSSTLPKEVRRVSQLVLKREHAYINTIGLDPETHDKVNQYCVVAPHEEHFQIVHHLLKDHIAQFPDYKVIVFCTTAMMTSLVFSLLREMRMNVREIHSRKPQLYRTRVSKEFKEAEQLILITSDVSARGMNYPDVSLVIQMGVPVDREQYINRLGRTGREGKGGEGILVIAPWEEYFLEELKDLPIHESSSPHLDPDMKVKIEKSMAKVDPSVKEAAYHAWLGYYNSIKETGRDKTTLVELSKGFCDSIGLQKVPTLFRKTVVKMGLKDIPGIKIRR